MPWSLYAFPRSPDDYPQTIRAAAMAGAISGARPGLGAIPRGPASKLTDRGSWGLDELCALAGECRGIRFGASPGGG